LTFFLLKKEGGAGAGLADPEGWIMGEPWRETMKPLHTGTS